MSSRRPVVQAWEKVANLEKALSTSRVISMGVGILMATFKITDREAFDMLVVVSQQTHRKLREIAEELVETGTLDWGGSTAMRCTAARLTSQA